MGDWKPAAARSASSRPTSRPNTCGSRESTASRPARRWVARARFRGCSRSKIPTATTLDRAAGLRRLGAGSQTGSAELTAASAGQESGRCTWRTAATIAGGAQLVVPGLVAVDLAQPVGGTVRGQPLGGGASRGRPRPPTRAGRCREWPPSGRPPLRAVRRRPPPRSSCSWYAGERQPLSTENRTPPSRHGRRRAQGGRAALGRAWRHPGTGRRRPSRRRGLSVRPASPSEAASACRAAGLAEHQRCAARASGSAMPRRRE